MEIRAHPLILGNGAVLIGRNFVCDAHANRFIRIVTHAHIDHTLGLDESFSSCKHVIMTPTTKELIETLYRFPFSKFGDKTVLLHYKETFEFLDEKVTFFNAGHIIGSAQVLVETEGESVVYTGDFKLPEAEVIPSDVLVMEATYGNPSCLRPFKDSVEDEFAKLVKESLKTGPVYIFGYHGKLQEAIGILRRKGVTSPIILPERVYNVAKICEKYGMKLGDYIPINSEEAREVMKGGNFIAVYHMASRRRITNATKIYLSGWEFESACRKIRDGEYTVALSDHSDFDELLEYVERSRPKLVITDNYRIGDAVALAKEIRRRLGIEAKPMP
jgi:putative mRNA 3-end processing factor